MHIMRVVPAVLATMAAFVSADQLVGPSRHAAVPRDLQQDPVEMYIGLEPVDRGQLQRVLREVSDPHHPKYGKHLGREDAQDLLRPPPEASGRVRRWLLEAGVDEEHIENRGSWIHARIPSQMARSLSTAPPPKNLKRDQMNPMELDERSVPKDVRSFISTIQPISGVARRDFGARDGSGPELERRSTTQNRAAGRNSNDVDLEKCIDLLTPACMRKIYHIDAPPAVPHPKTLFAVAGLGGQAAQYDQLQMFLDEYAPYAEDGTFTVALANGGENPQGEVASSEANLNIQYAVAMSYNVSVQFIAVGGGLEDYIPDLDMPKIEGALVEPFLELATYVLGLPDDELPQVLSISYSMNEQVVPPEYARETCDIFGILGIRGVSVLSSSGNRGPGASCVSNDGTNSTRFLPAFPATCPYVTAVGGTVRNSPEVVADFSGGGFSEYWDSPIWQKDSLDKYFGTLGDEWEGYYNANGRGIPDVALQAWNYPMYTHDTFELSGGTSGATPFFGSMIALINNDRFHRGKPPMGFLNPWIYSIAGIGFTDITEGKSVGCDGTTVSGDPAPIVPGAGWRAVEGWDPATGVGTPLFDRLKRLACL